MSQERIVFNTESEDKKAFQELVAKLGLNISTALNLVIKSAIREQRLSVSLALDPLLIANSPERIALNKELVRNQH